MRMREKPAWSLEIDDDFGLLKDLRTSIYAFLGAHKQKQKIHLPSTVRELIHNTSNFEGKLWDLVQLEDLCQGEPASHSPYTHFLIVNTLLLSLYTPLSLCYSSLFFSLPIFSPSLFPSLAAINPLSSFEKISCRCSWEQQSTQTTTVKLWIMDNILGPESWT